MEPSHTLVDSTPRADDDELLSNLLHPALPSANAKVQAQWPDFEPQNDAILYSYIGENVSVDVASGWSREDRLAAFVACFDLGWSVRAILEFRSIIRCVLF